ncbi:hypothetical protein M427DRAFT_57911 [Gonapodya prolifera JEL478]|uniref:Uncharacterized protein n=1 Tax=Gonapodya prolifera (strain JEL478) TaxID=1344416 RepID=A0A139ACG8_GONPJ|nr:hypothetical protein M427DRAFT_57911 [Gonapodya prolifera JEL478]|eukprot:KXS14145.1 hypothetical protein M427DRAFT_57911 [Gonapodya prolifera JEL478]
MWGDQAYPSSELSDLTTLHIRIESFSGNEGSNPPADILAALAWIENLSNLSVIHLTFLVVVQNWAFTSEQKYIQMTEKSALRMSELLFKPLRVMGRRQPRTDIVLGDVTYQITNVSGTHQGYSTRTLIDSGAGGAGSADITLRFGLRQTVVHLGEKVGLNVRRCEEL